MKGRIFKMIGCIAVTASLLAGCQSTDNGDGDTAAVGADQDDTGEADAITTVGPDSGKQMEMWTFVDLHSNYYAEMLNRWNKANPERQLQITFLTYPYDEMHNKLTMALQTGAGAPDLCDIEISKFPNYLKGEVQLYPLNEAIAQYEDDIVRARLDIYSKDGNYYGAPHHVGACVMYYNTEVFERYDIDYSAIRTWADYEAAGQKLKAASDGEIKMTSVDTGASDWLWLSMAEHGEDWIDSDGKANVELASIERMLTMQKRWLDEEIAMVSPDGHIDIEAGYQNILDGNIASFPKALWYMQRFLSYMPEETGKWALAPCPVFEEGQPRSVGLGGTGTVVTNQAADAELAAEFIAYAKCSYEGNVQNWEILGQDCVNTEVWKDQTITHNADNSFIKYFKTNPFDVLNEIEDEIGRITVAEISPTILENLQTMTLNSIMEDGQDVKEALAEAQAAIELEE